MPHEYTTIAAPSVMLHGLRNILQLNVRAADDDVFPVLVETLLSFKSESGLMWISRANNIPEVPTPMSFILEISLTEILREGRSNFSDGGCFGNLFMSCCADKHVLTSPLDGKFNWFLPPTETLL